jgi:transcriptional regulator with XRE-family HTH domain
VKGGSILSTIGERIKQVRLSASLTQAEFGKEIGVSGATVSTSESGKTNPEPRTIILICDKFGINRQWLETGEGERLKLQEASSLIPRLQRIFSSYPAIAHTLETALAVMKDEDFQRLSEIIEECKKNARG